MKSFLLLMLCSTMAMAQDASLLEEQGHMTIEQFKKKASIANMYHKVLKINEHKSLTALHDEFIKAEIVIEVNKAKAGTSAWAQKMRVYHRGVLLKTFKVSTGKEVKVTASNGKTYVSSTPVGYYRPATIWKEYQSSTWVGARMNFPIFFTGGIAMHSTTPDHFNELGTRDSGGCVRLHPDDAIWLNELVLTTGLDSFEIINRPNIVNGVKITREQVVGGEVSVASVRRVDGVMQGQKVKSWDTLIIIRNVVD